jgi:hypothetical protein
MKLFISRDITTIRATLSTIIALSLLLAAVISAISYNVPAKAQTAPLNSNQTQISNASNAKNTNATSAIAAPSIANHEQLSKAVGNSSMKFNIVNSTPGKEATAKQKFTLNTSKSGLPSNITNGSSISNQNKTRNIGNGSVKTIIATAPGAGATIVTTGNKTMITTATTPKTGSNVMAFNRTGFTNLYVLTINGKAFPTKYSIVGGKLVGMLADKDRTTLVLVLNPSANGGKFAIELPRNVIDSKGASNTDTKYLVKIDGKGVDYKEGANNLNARILSIDFSKDNRFMEIIGTQMGS